MRWILPTGAFRLSGNTSTATRTTRNLPGETHKNRMRGNLKQVRRRNLKPRVRRIRSKKMRLATEASLEDCFVMLRVRSSCYVTYLYATNRCNSVSRDCTAESAPRE